MRSKLVPSLCLSGTRSDVLRMLMAGVMCAGMGLASAPSMAEEVQIPGPAGPLSAEALAVPDAAHAVVIIPGSGPIDRDGNAPVMGLKSDAYRQLAEQLGEAGIASLRVDKRGFFGSEKAISDPNQVTIAEYAADARGWAAKARTLAPCVWLAGHSEGGLVALVAATQAPDEICGIILMAAPGRPVGKLLVEQMESNPATAALAPQIRDIVADLEAGKPRDPQTIPAALQPMFTPGLQRFMMDLFSYDPAALAGKWKGPALILQGDHDMQVKTQDADLLAAAMPQAQKHILPGATHMLKPDQPGQPFATYVNPALPLDAAVVPTIAGFVKAGRP